MDDDEDTLMQSPIFAVGLVIKDVLEKGRKVWLMLQNMHKIYNLVGWYYLRASLQYIKICERFIKFFGGIHKDRLNRVMTDFGFLDKYWVLNGLD
ncbi:hypothetical protein G9A89_009234 [Geosiphon pyriformis]|nr:hypothetical protein G9A89_009234 [Geosiphon pyriformis]